MGQFLQRQAKRQRSQLRHQLGSGQTLRRQSRAQSDRDAMMGANHGVRPSPPHQNSQKISILNNGLIYESEALHRSPQPPRPRETGKSRLCSNSRDRIQAKAADLRSAVSAWGDGDGLVTPTQKTVPHGSSHLGNAWEIGHFALRPIDVKPRATPGAVRFLSMIPQILVKMKLGLATREPWPL